MPDTLLVWVDIETTGLDHESDHMLELASVVTDRAGVELGRFEEVVNVGAPVSELCMGEAVEAMHRANGLLDRVAAAGEGRNEDAVIDAWLEWAAGWRAGTAARLVLAGSGVARFDVPWLQARAGIDAPWPFYWREFDVSALADVFRWAGWPLEYVERPHTAGGDLAAIIGQWREVRRRLGNVDVGEVDAPRAAAAAEPMDEISFDGITWQPAPALRDHPAVSS